MTDNNQSILLVEDNEVNRDMLVRRLQRAGHQVTTAGDGEAALEAMRQQQPTVVLMDMNLPIKDGWTACREAQQDTSIADIPIIAYVISAVTRSRIDNGIVSWIASTNFRNVSSSERSRTSI